jgi:hypothetical protein
MDNDNSVEERSTGSAAQQQSPGIDILNRLLASLREGDSSAQRAAWISIQDPNVMTSLAESWQSDNDTVETLLITIGSIRGQRTRSRNLKSAIRNLSDSLVRRRSDDLLDEIEENLSNNLTLSACFANAGPPATIVSPDILALLVPPRGFAIDAAGVYRLSASPEGDLVRTRIAAAPFFIAGRTSDVLTGEAKLQAIWRGPAGWCSRVVSRRTLMDTSKLIGLADLEAPVSSMNLANLVSYLADFEAENRHRLSSLRSTPRMGWQPGGGFLLPESYYATADESDEQLVLTPPAGFESMSKGWMMTGTWEGWLEAASLVSPYPHMHVAIYASVAAPLMKLLRLPGFVVDFSGETSGGKTTALRFAASVWGKPSENYPTAMYSWDATKVWIERTAGYLQNLPLLLDETKRAKHNGIVRDVIYDFCQGQGRGRGAVEGTRYTDSWQSILISTGEGAATDFSEDAGTRARVLSLKGKPLGSNPDIGGQVSEETQAILANNHGHLGRRVIEYLVANQPRHDEIRAVYKEARDKYAHIATSAVARRHAAHLAALEIAAGITMQLGMTPCQEDPFAFLIECQEAAGRDADRPLAAFQDMLSWCAANAVRFHGRHEMSGHGHTRVPMHGWAGRWSKDQDWAEIQITTLTMREVLKNLGHHPAEILNRWAERNWIVVSPDGKSRRSRPVRIEGAIMRCYCISREAMETCLGD